MRILCFGSINIDHVYQVPHFVQPGETLAASGFQGFAGGKGLNQSIALARAGASVFHAGKVGGDGDFAIDQLRSDGVDTSHIVFGATPTGHAIIQVAPDGQNSILIFGGANQEISAEEVDRTLAKFSPGDFLLIQNEINGIPDLIAKAKARKMKTVFNPAPMTADVAGYPIGLLDYFIVNEGEGAELTGCTEPTKILDALRALLSHTSIVLTLGEQGVLFSSAVEQHQQLHQVPAYCVQVADTTAAGDTFIGFFVHEISHGSTIQEALQLATSAAALCVMRPGASSSIPLREEVIAHAFASN